MPPAVTVDCLQLWFQDGRLRGPDTNQDATEPESAESVPVPSSADGGPETRVGSAWEWKGRAEDFVVEDGNAATHLARNALGGKRREQFCTLLGVLAPHKDDAHDDVTVQVLFFGGGRG